MDSILSALKRWWYGTDSALSQLSGDHKLYQVVYQGWAGGFTVASDLARREAGWVAVAATLGLITTREADGSFGRVWYVTEGGIRFINNYWDTE